MGIFLRPLRSILLASFVFTRVETSSSFSLELPASDADSVATCDRASSGSAMIQHKGFQESEVQRNKSSTQTASLVEGVKSNGTSNVSAEAVDEHMIFARTGAKLSQAQPVSSSNVSNFSNKTAKLEAETPAIISDAELEGNHAFSTVHGLASHVIVPVAVIFLLGLAISHVLSLSSYTKWIPESAAILTVALLLGDLLKRLLQAGAISNRGQFALGASAILNLFLLPIIIFASGWSLRRADFIFQFTPIIIFAVLGTIISTLFIGFVSFQLAQTGLHVVTDMRSNMVFAALISAVDPVATLVTYKALAVEPLLNIMVFGESTINDAVAVVLFSMVNERWEVLSFTGAAWRVMQLLFGSIIFAWGLSVLLLLIMRVTKIRHDKHASILFIWITPFFVYALAEATGMFSGIIATLVAGIVFGTYGRFHLEGGGPEEADSFFELTSGLADKAVFMLCGASTAMITSYKGVYFGCCAVVLCVAGRICSVLPCSAVVNCYKQSSGDPHVLNWKHVFMMCHGGLRGGIALVLALQIDATWCPFKATILNGTFIVICVLLLFCGGSTEFFLKKLEIPMGEEDDNELVFGHQSTAVQIMQVVDDYMTQLTTGEMQKKSRLLVNEVSGMHPHHGE